MWLTNTLQYRIAFKSNLTPDFMVKMRFDVVHTRAAITHTNLEKL